MTNRQTGFALLIVLWTVGFLALLGTQIVASGRSDTRLADNLKQEAQLAAAADGAVADLMFRLLAARDPHYQPDGTVRTLSIGQTPIFVRIENESDRVNLNTASGALVRALIIQTGAAPVLADHIAAAILDWRTAGTNPRPGGAKASDYKAAGRAYGPPEAPFRSVNELSDVLGMTPDLFARLAPHLTVLTDGDPDTSTRDPVVARALSDTAGVADITDGAEPSTNQVFRLSITAQGTGSARYSIIVVASAEFQTATPRINILSRERGPVVTSPMPVASDGR